jgi:hypothetical protein
VNSFVPFDFHAADLLSSDKLMLSLESKTSDWQSKSANSNSATIGEFSRCMLISVWCRDILRGRKLPQAVD